MTSERLHVLGLCALPEELQALREAAGPAGTLRDPRTALPGFDAELGRTVLYARQTGVGLEAARRNAKRALAERAPWSAVLGFGVAGALTSDLAVGDVVAAARVTVGGADEPAATCAAARTVAEHAGFGVATMVSVERVVTRRHERRELASLHGDGDRVTVDMESWAWVQAAEEVDLPWLVLRGVSDLATQELPQFLDRPPDARGAVQRAPIALAAAVRPWTWGALLRLAGDTRRAAAEVAAVTLKVLATEAWLGQGADLPGLHQEGSQA